MGVYVIKSKYNDWLKIGHHKITERKPNVYFRYISRGFYSCKHPNELKDKVSFEDLKLIYWFSNLNVNDEKKIHKYLKKNKIYDNYGEWYSGINIEEIKNIITHNFNGILDMPTEYDFNIADKWCRNIKHSRCSKENYIYLQKENT